MGIQEASLTRSREEDTKSTKPVFDELSRQVVDVAYHIHQAMGPGLLESIYEECFEIILKKRNVPFETQKQIPVRFEGETLSTFLRLDLVVDGRIVVELKSIDHVVPAHTSQILSYMRIGSYKTGLLINFGEPYFKNAVRRFVL